MRLGSRRSRLQVSGSQAMACGSAQTPARSGHNLTLGSIQESDTSRSTNHNEYFKNVE